MTKEVFEYAKLFQQDGVTREIDCEKPGLVMGPKTKAKFEANTDDVAVTVCCITYKHEEYIRQALDSFLAQKTTFNYKIFVGEDCGPDSTADIVREYAEKYPDKIVAFCREKNMGAQTNLVDLCQRANSPYISICEGDDFWIDEYKLQKQFDYMQENPDIRVCYTHTEILAPEDWHLNDYYLHDDDGKMILPRCTPGFVEREFYTVKDFVNVFPGHTSSVFYRWDYDLEFPDWYFTGLIGDTPMLMLQLGTGRTHYLPDVCSVYRRSDVGVFMSASTEEHFLNTRLDYVRLLAGCRSYFESYYGDSLSDVFGARIGREVSNFLSSAVKVNAFDQIDEAMGLYPREFRGVLLWFMQRSKGFGGIQNAIGAGNVTRICSNKKFRKYIKGCIKLYNKGLKIKNTVGYPFVRLFQSIGKMPYRFAYFRNGKVKKQKDLWVITSFRHKGYVDNSKYFYEYVSANHPEIELVWLTTDDEVLEKLQAENMRVLRMDSAEGKKVMKRAQIAITDHFVSSDYSPKWGFNSGTKVVQLWHGVGFKSMGNGVQVENTKEPGVRYSYDILPQPGDGLFRRMRKKMLYFFRAPYRELFEKYFMLVCPGQERVEKIGLNWNMPESTFFMAGHPRDIDVYNQHPVDGENKILYAPTYRFNAAHERRLILSVLENAPKIQEMMEKMNAEFYLRMHPHTWRNYNNLLTTLSENYSRIFIDDEPDIYTHIGTFRLVITDYSSISLDFANIGGPVLFHCPDYEWFMEHEAGFGVDFENVIPGIMTRTWDKTLEEIELHLQDSNRYKKEREERIQYFFDSSANASDNSERIVTEIKRRLGI